MHMTGGMVALLSGPRQFWTGFRARFVRLHRWTGRLFLSGVALGSIGAFRIAIVDASGWAFGFALFALALAWVTTAAVAFYAILSGSIQVHKEWMVRTYVVTFAFVTFRLLNDFTPLSRLQPDGDRIVTIAWACWSFRFWSRKSSCNSAICARLLGPVERDGLARWPDIQASLHVASHPRKRLFAQTE